MATAYDTAHERARIAGMDVIDEGVEHWHAPDIDPQGLSICLESPIEGVWAPSVTDLEGIQGDPWAFERQSALLPGLTSRITTSAPALAGWYHLIRETRSGFTQERAWANGLPFRWHRFE